MAVGSAAIGLQIRRDRYPRRFPKLTREHLKSLVAADLPRPRVLFIGNSMVLRNDMPEMVQALARDEGVDMAVAVAAANGARLTDTLRVGELWDVLSMDWDVVVVQDFTSTALSKVHAWASHRAIDRIAAKVAPTPLLLYPTNPGAPGHRVYADAGRFATTPDGPEDFAARTTAHYAATGHEVAPVADAWIEAKEYWPEMYHDDGHHPSVAGSRFIARVLWDALKSLLV